METYRIKLPLPPLLSEYYENRKGVVQHGPRAGAKYMGRMVSPAGELFRGLVFTEARRYHRIPPKLTGPLDITALICKPSRTKAGAKATNRKGDLDNRFKALLDALTYAQIITDDVLFDDIRMIRGDPVEWEGECHLAIRRFNPDEALAAAAALGLPIRAKVAAPGETVKLPF